VTPQRITSARISLLYAEQLMRLGKISPDIYRPSALLGVFASGFLSTSAEASVSTALAGVEIQQAFIMQNREHVSEAFAILTALSDTLEVNITDMLNRSATRQETLDTYTESLNGLFEEAKVQAEGLAQEQREKDADAKAKRAIVTNIQRDVTRARSNKDYTTVSQKQEQLVSAQSDLAGADAKVKEVKTTLSVLNELIDITAERLSAITQNREILISGLKVVDVPGIEDLGIILERNSRNTGNSGTNNVFGEPL